MNRVHFASGEQGRRFAEILGLAPERLRKNASIVIECDMDVVARVEIRLTPDELLAIVAMLNEDRP